MLLGGGKERIDGICNHNRPPQSCTPTRAANAALRGRFCLMVKVVGRYRINMKKGRKIFPEYDRSRPEMMVSDGLLNLAKMKAASIIRSNAYDEAQTAFRAYAVRKYHVKPQQVTFDKRCIRRIRRASLSFE